MCGEVDAQTMESKEGKGLYFAGRFWMSMASAAVIISVGVEQRSSSWKMCWKGSQINDTSKSGKTAGQPQWGPDLRKKTAKMMGI